MPGVVELLPSATILGAVELLPPATILGAVDLLPPATILGAVEAKPVEAMPAVAGAEMLPPTTIPSAVVEVLVVITRAVACMCTHPSVLLCPNVLTEYSCKQEGHMARDCPDKPEGFGMTGECYNCGQTG